MTGDSSGIWSPGEHATDIRSFHVSDPKDGPTEYPALVLFFHIFLVVFPSSPGPSPGLTKERAQKIGYFQRGLGFLISFRSLHLHGPKSARIRVLSPGDLRFLSRFSSGPSPGVNLPGAPFPAKVRTETVTSSGVFARRDRLLILK